MTDVVPRMNYGLLKKQELVLIRTAYSTTILSMFITNDLIRTNTLIQVRDRYLEGMTQDENSSLYGEFGQPNRNMYTVIPLGVVVNNISWDLIFLAGSWT